MKNKNYIYKSTENIKGLTLSIGVIIMGLVVSEYLMILKNMPVWFMLLVFIGTIIIALIGFNAAMPIKIDKKYIYLPYGYREKKEKKKIPLSEVLWIKRINKPQGRKGLKFRDKDDEYFIPSFFGQSDEVMNALEKAMDKRFYKVYEGED